MTDKARDAWKEREGELPLNSGSTLEANLVIVVSWTLLATPTSPQLLDA